ncbi:hypothetical protein C8Q72DRAFT_429196 [Fomitopsis betulina]|nr:hypothetical protein C8Q72DRAFT_429196 [Fomitopsis betulina]
MLANVTTHPDRPGIDPLVLYAQSLHDYTLRLWTESRRAAEEKSRARAAEIASAKKWEEERLRQKKPSLNCEVTSAPCLYISSSLFPPPLLLQTLGLLPHVRVGS